MQNECYSVRYLNRYWPTLGGGMRWMGGRNSQSEISGKQWNCIFLGDINFECAQIWLVKVRKLWTQIWWQLAIIVDNHKNRQISQLQCQLNVREKESGRDGNSNKINCTLTIPASASLNLLSESNACSRFSRGKFRNFHLIDFLHRSAPFS